MQVATVVVVDDEPPIVGLLCDTLDDAGYTAVSCLFGAKAYPCVLEHLPQLVLLDVQMPGVDGIQVFEQIRSNPLTMAIPVIFLTANSQLVKQRLPDYRARGAALLPKPFDLETLLNLVEQFAKAS